jgi:hypothetical protein
MTATKNLATPEWLPSELYGEAVVSWRLTTDNRHRDWRYQIITDQSVYTARTDGKLIAVAVLNKMEGNV